jgi:very-short-patch-repair endonuclease
MSLAIIVVAVIAALWVIRKIGRGGRPVGDHWPLYSKSLLTERETEFYRRLETMYPEHCIFVQVALSQLLDVIPGTRDRRAIRNRFNQLVADFVLCRRDLSVVAVIELDDSSHSTRERQTADWRKAKAVESAGLRLVRIPAGPIPSMAELRRVIRAEQLELCRDEQIAGNTLTQTHTEIVRWLWPVLVPTLIAVAVVGGWFVYSGLLASALPKIAIPAHPPIAPPASSTAPPVSVAQVDLAAQDDEQRQEQAEKTLAAQHAAEVLAKRKAAAWSSFYRAPASCEHPPAWSDQVECGNQYMRAKKEFETKWQAQLIAEGAGGKSESATETSDGR